jgi:hypothetical protein
LGLSFIGTTFGHGATVDTARMGSRSKEPRRGPGSPAMTDAMRG